MDERILYGIIASLGLVCSFLAIFVIVPAHRADIERAKTAAKISKYFGDAKIHLFRFDETGDNGEKRYVFALLEYDKWNAKELKEIKKHYTVCDIEVSKCEKALKEIDCLRDILPYDIGMENAGMTFREYRESVRTVDGSDL